MLIEMDHQKRHFPAVSPLCNTVLVFFTTYKSFPSCLYGRQKQFLFFLFKFAFLEKNAYETRKDRLSNEPSIRSFSNKIHKSGILPSTWKYFKGDMHAWMKNIFFFLFEVALEMKIACRVY